MSEYGATVAWHLPPQASFDYETFDRLSGTPRY